MNEYAQCSMGSVKKKKRRCLRFENWKTKRIQWNIMCGWWKVPYLNINSLLSCMTKASKRWNSNLFFSIIILLFLCIINNNNNTIHSHIMKDKWLVWQSKCNPSPDEADKLRKKKNLWDRINERAMEKFSSILPHMCA